jgi:hypothetical protein
MQSKDELEQGQINPVRNSSRFNPKPSGALAAQALAQRVKAWRNYSEI